MTTETIQKLTYDLTLEYVKQSKLFECHRDSLKTKIEDVARISDIINNSILENENKFKL